MNDKGPEEVRYDLGGWISGACDTPDPDAVELEALCEEHGDSWSIVLTPTRRWEATRRPVPYEILTAPTANVLREQLVEREREQLR